MNKVYYIILIFLVFICLPDAFAQTSADSLFLHYSLEMYRDREKPYLSLNSLLDYFPGLYQFGVQTPEQSRSVLINGSRDNHSVILINGLPVQDYLKGTPDFSFIPVENIKNITLYPGLNPFGINTVGGVINITTKECDFNKPYTKFVYRSGSGLFSDFDVTYGQSITRKINLVSGVMMKKFGVRKSTNQELPYRKYHAQKTRATLKYAMNDNTNFQYSVLSNRHDLRIPYNIPFNEDSSATPSKDIFRIDHTLLSSLNLNNMDSYFWLNYTSEKINLKEFRFYPQKHLSYQAAQGKFLQRTKIYVPVNWGIDYSRCSLTDTSGRKLSFYQNNLFIQLLFPFFDKIHFLTEFNYHNTKYTDPAVKFSGLMSYAPTKKLDFTVEYDQNTHAPELQQIYGIPILYNTPLTENNFSIRNDDSAYNTNFNLITENSQRIQFHGQYNSAGNFSLTTLLYYQTCNDLITIDQLNQGKRIFDNTYNTTYTGLNSTVFLKIFKNLELSSLLNVIRTVKKNTLHYIDLPGIQGLTSLSWNHDFFKDDLHVTLFASIKYWSQFNLYTLTDDHTFIRQLIEPGAVFNAKASLRFMEHTYATFALDNILNKKISGKYHVFIPHTFYRIGISWELFN